MLWELGRSIGIAAAIGAAAAALLLLIPRAAASRRRVRALAFAGWLGGWALAPFWAISDGIERFDREADPAYAFVAQQAYHDAWMHNDNPIARIALPAVRVRRVWRDPGHCPGGQPGAQEPYADWRAEVRFYTYFGIPGPLLRVTCGGWAW